jgi:hypothetical protein
MSPLNCSLIQIAEADMAVGDEWAEAELSGQGQGARVVAVGYLILGALRDALTRQVEGTGLGGAFESLPRQRPRPLGEHRRLAELPRQKVCLVAQTSPRSRLAAPGRHCLGSAHLRPALPY